MARAAPSRAAFRIGILALALTLPGPVLAAGFACAAPVDSAGTGALDELEEVVVSAAKVRTKTSDLEAWLKRLVGQYTYSGHIDLCGNGNVEDQRPVTGRASCIGAGAAPHVQCTVNVRWPPARGGNGESVPGGESSLVPAFVIYALESRYVPERKMNRLGLMFTQVDNKGVAERGSGELVGDTFTSSEPCVGIPGACRKITRITARPDAREISMVIDVVVDSRRTLRQQFLLRREPAAADGTQRKVSSP